jgi:Smr domain.
MKMKLVNLEAGMPTVDIGQKKLSLEITTAKRQGIKLLKVIHGYGSSGVGGGLKKGIHEMLIQQKKTGMVKGFVPGEDWSIFNQEVRDMLDKYRDLKKDRDLGSGNPGITMVLL